MSNIIIYLENNKNLTKKIQYILDFLLERNSKTDIKINLWCYLKFGKSFVFTQVWKNLRKETMTNFDRMF